MLGSAGMRRCLLSCLASMVLTCNLTGCQTSCGPSDQASVRWTEGKVVTRGAERLYRSTPLDGTWLHFPSHRSFRLEHGLRTKDIVIQSYLSYSSNPVPKGSVSPAGFAQAGGEVVVISEVTADAVVLENDTCENDFYLFVNISAPAANLGAGGASGR